MIKSNLIPVLKSFSKKELNEFEKFLNSPFFGCKKFVLNYYKVLIKHYPEFKEEDIGKEKLFGIVYKDRKYNDALNRRIVSDLLRFAEEYMTYINFKRERFMTTRCTLNELRSRKLEKLFQLRSESMLDRIEKSPTVDPSLMLESYFVHMEMSTERSSIRNEKRHESSRRAAEDFISIFICVFYSYLRHTITFVKEIRKNSELMSGFLSNFNFDSFLKAIDSNQSIYNVYIKMIGYSYKIVYDIEDKKAVNDLWNLLNNNPGYFSKKDMLDIYVTLVTFYRYHNNKYDNIYLNEELYIYNDILKHKIYFNLQLSFCRNYIRLSALKPDPEKIREFSEEYSPDFPPEYKQDLIEYCESVYSFEKKLFERSLTAASKVNIEKELFKKDIKILKIKNYYELDYTDSVYSEIDNLKHFLTDAETINAEAMTKSRKFIKYISAIMRGKEKKSNTDLFVLKKELSKEVKTEEKNWLLTKTEELLKTVG
ncbi:MAG: hypothetical protein JSS91_13875 [Bacteroidetes bacterium]|nr:hypothetical protein [Bacteroidota bacterium]